jgi:hypothetical protein
MNTMAVARAEDRLRQRKPLPPSRPKSTSFLFSFGEMSDVAEMLAEAEASHVSTFDKVYDLESSEDRFTMSADDWQEPVAEHLAARAKLAEACEEAAKVMDERTPEFVAARDAARESLRERAVEMCGDLIDLLTAMDRESRAARLARDSIPSKRFADRAYSGNPPGVRQVEAVREALETMGQPERIYVTPANLAKLQRRQPGAVDVEGRPIDGMSPRRVVVTHAPRYLHYEGQHLDKGSV